MLSFARIADAIRATSKKLEKVAILAGYLKQLPLDQAAAAAVVFSGRPFPAFEEATLQVGAALLWRVSADVAQVSETELSAHSNAAPTCNVASSKAGNGRPEKKTAAAAAWSKGSCFR